MQEIQYSTYMNFPHLSVFELRINVNAINILAPICCVSCSAQFFADIMVRFDSVNLASALLCFELSISKYRLYYFMLFCILCFLYVMMKFG